MHRLVFFHYFAEQFRNLWSVYLFVFFLDFDFAYLVQNITKSDDDFPYKIENLFISFKLPYLLERTDDGKVTVKY